MHRVIQFYQEAQMKPYIDTNTKLRKEAKNDFEKDFLKLMKKANVRMNKAIYLGMSILDISKKLMHEFWYDYTKPDVWRQSETMSHGY